MSTENLLNIAVNDKSTALDLIFGFLHTAQRRGAFNFPESAKIYECMQQFRDFFNNQPPQEESIEGEDDEEN